MSVNGGGGVKKTAEGRRALKRFWRSRAFRVLPDLYKPGLRIKKTEGKGNTVDMMVTVAFAKQIQKACFEHLGGIPPQT